MGLSRSESDALREYLLDRTADLDGGERLAMAAAQYAKRERDAADVFMSVSEAIRQSILEQGRAALGAISDDEWEALIAPDEEPDNALS